VSTQPVEGNALLNVAGAAAYLGVTDAFVRRLVLEKRVSLATVMGPPRCHDLGTTSRPL